jgi:hypothetical protein
MTTIRVEGVSGVRKMLAPFLEPELTRNLQEATKQGAKQLKAPLKAAVAPLSKRMSASVYVHKAKRDRPATVIGHHVKKAFFWHMVIGGTKDHGPRAAPYMVIGLNALRGSGSRQARISGPGALRGQGLRRVSHVRGVKAHPVIEQIARSNESKVVDAMHKHIASLSR